MFLAGPKPAYCAQPASGLRRLRSRRTAGSGQLREAQTSGNLQRMIMAEIQPNVWMVAPFVALLAAIALAPLFFADWWGRHFGKVTLVLAAITLGYYLAGLHAQERVLRTAEEYLSFICLVGSLFVVSGGIHINVKGEATPLVNVVFLLVGALVANVLGTTGASMLLIRPWLRMNKYRLTAHHVVFFIFIVSNVGGCLTPVGDPPLFLGYLKGVPFWWVAAQCWPMWLVGVGILLAMFFVAGHDRTSAAPRAACGKRKPPTSSGAFRGCRTCSSWPWCWARSSLNHPPFLREALMVAAAAGSYLTTAKAGARSQRLQLPSDQGGGDPVRRHLRHDDAGAGLAPGQRRPAGPARPPGLFFWGSGALSSVLDNAPTYLSFLSAEFGAFVSPDAAAAVAAYVKAHGADLLAAAGAPHAEQICQAIAALQTHFPANVLQGQDRHPGAGANGAGAGQPALMSNASRPSASAPSSSAPTPTSATAPISWSRPSPTSRRRTPRPSWATSSSSPSPSWCRCCCIVWWLFFNQR